MLILIGSIQVWGQAPANDECSGAIPITPQVYAANCTSSTSVSTVGAVVCLFCFTLKLKYFCRNKFGISVKRFNFAHNFLTVSRIQKTNQLLSMTNKERKWEEALLRNSYLQLHLTVIREQDFFEGIR